MSKEENIRVPHLRFQEFEDGGEWNEISLVELGNTVNGLSGKSASDFGIGQPYITYMQVFKNSCIDIDECGRVQILENEKQNSIQTGDVLVTTSSETPEEVGFASVLLESPSEPDHLFYPLHFLCSTHTGLLADHSPVEHILTSRSEFAVPRPGPLSP